MKKASQSALFAMLLLALNAGAQAPVNSVPELPDFTYADAQDSSFFFQEAERHGYTVTNDEIQERRALRRLICPNELKEPDTSDEQIRKILIIEKHLAAEVPALVSEDEISAQYDSLTKNLPQDRRPSFEDALPFITHQARVSNEANRSFLRARVNQHVNLQRAEQYRQRMQTPLPVPPPPGPFSGTYESDQSWRFEDLKLRGYSDDCVAYEANTGQCLVTLELFNKHALRSTLSKDYSLDSARYYLLNKVLLSVLASRKASETGFMDLPETQKKLEMRVQGKLSTYQTKRTVPIDSLDLRKLYREHYDSLFAEKEEVILDVLGSSDSVFIDSVYRLLHDGTQQGKAQRTRHSRESLKLISSLPWRQTSGEGLPPELRIPSDTIAEGGVTPVIKMPYGYFIIRVADVTFRDEVPFSEAAKTILDLVDRGDFAPRRRVTEKEARNFYDHYPKRFISEDTVFCRVFVSPDTSVLPFEPEGFHLGHLNWLRIASTDCPKEIRECLRRHVRQPQFDSTLRPIYHPTGIWNIRIDRVGVGDTPIPFLSVKDRIMKHLAKSGFSDATQGQAQKLLRDEECANLYWQHVLHSIPDPDDNEIERAVSLGNISDKDIPESAPEGFRAAILKQKYKVEKRKEVFDQWKTGIIIDEMLYM